MFIRGRLLHIQEVIILDTINNINVHKVEKCLKEDSCREDDRIKDGLRATLGSRGLRDTV